MPEEYDWVEKKQVKRDDWMLEAPKFLDPAKPRKKNHETRKEEQERVRIQTRNDRELKEIEHKDYEFGDRGSSWRMMKLKRVFQEQDVVRAGIDEYGDLNQFKKAVEERIFLDKRESKGFQKPQTSKNHPQKVLKQIEKQELQEKLDKERAEVESRKEEESSIRNVQKHVEEEPILNIDELNLLYSKVLKARLMKSSDLEALEAEYVYEKQLFDSAERRMARDSREHIPKKQRKDRNRNQNQEEPEMSLSDMVRDEKLHKTSNFDSEMAHQISRDSSFKNTLDYLDQSSDHLSRGHTKSILL